MLEVRHRAEAAADAVDHHLRDRIGLVVTLAAMPALLQRELPAFAASEGSGARHDLMLLDPAGRMLVDTRDPAVAGHGTGPPADAIASARASLRAQLGNVVQSGSRHVAYVTAPVVQNGEVASLLVLELGLPELSAILSRERSPAGWICVVIDRNGVIAARTHDPERWTGQIAVPELLAARASGSRGPYEVVTKEGVRLEAYYVNLAGGWTVALGVPVRQLHGVTVRSRWFVVSLLMMSILVTTLGAFAVGRHLRRLVADVADAAAAVGDGKAPKQPRSSIRELAEVGSALQMAHALIAGRERALRAGEERFRAIADYTFDWESWIGTDGRPVWINPAVQRLTGHSVADCIRMADYPLPLVHAEDRERIRRLLEDALRGASGNDVTFRIQRKDGRVIWGAMSWQPIEAQGGAPLGVRASIRDVTDRKLGEDRLRASEERFRALTALSSDWYWEQDEHFRFVEMSQPVEQLAGSRAASHVGKTRWELPAVGVSEAEWQAHRALLEAHKPFRDFEYRRVSERGDVIWMSVSGDPMLAPDGRFLGYRGTGRNITDRKRGEEALRASEEQLRAIVETALDAIIVIDETGVVQSVNPAVERMFRYDASELVGGNVTVLMPEPHRSAHDSYLERYRQTGKGAVIGAGREVEARRKDGTTFPADLSVVEWRAGGRRFFTGILRDIGERKRREAQVQHLLREVNHRAKNLLGVVQAVAEQTATGMHAGFAAQFSDRLRALGASQDLLVKSQWQGVDLEALVRSQLGHFRGLIGTRILIGGPALRINADAAQLVGMAMHELATNAVKHGALANAEGRVTIGWRIEPRPGQADRLVMTWQERGGPPVAAGPKRNGFGTTVVLTMPRMELGADITLDFAPEGLCWRLDCPVGKVLDRVGDAAQEG